MTKLQKWRQISLDYITTAPPPNPTRLLHNTASYAGWALCSTLSLFAQVYIWEGLNEVNR